MIESIQPKKRVLVYNLVAEAGLDVSDWSNYTRPESPQTNPKYCYEWAFVGGDRVVVCLWFDAMREDDTGIYEDLNLRVIPRQHPDEDTTVARRRKVMDQALSTAHERHLTVRVIVVDGPVGADGKRQVKFRSLDVEPWHVTSYDDATGACRLRRSSGLPNPAKAPRISMIRFHSEFENLRAHLLAFDGFPFESFTRGKLHVWEGYKDYVFAEAGRRLNWRAWKPKEIGTGAILDRVIHAVEIADGKQKRNNLLQWKQYGVHRVLSEAKGDERCSRVESLLFDFYTDERDANEVFDPLVEELGKKYPLIAYLFFIKDSSRFLPIAPDKFDAIFRRLGVELKTTGRCGWENYSAYLTVIRELNGLLESEGIDGVRLLDAHSFCWLLSSLDEPAENEHGIATIEEVESFPGVAGGASARQIDWEALHQARAALGRLGEELALKAEKDRLACAGRPDLAERVQLISDDHTKGYDLHSFELDGSNRLIEVKTVSEDRSTIRFFTSQQQLDLAHSGVNHFYYLVRGARSVNPRIEAIRAHHIPAEAIRPIVHEVVWTENSD